MRYTMNHKGIRPPAAVLTLLLSLLLALALPVAAFAAPTDGTATDTAPGVTPDTDAAAEESINITMEYRYAEGEAVNIPQTLTQGGIGYNLISQAPPVLESSLPRTRTYTYKIDGSISKKDLAEIEKIPNIVLTPVNVELEREVDKEDVIKNLPNNDVDYLATQKEFNVTSAKAKTGMTKEQLKRAGVAYKVTKSEDGLPTEYQATVVYRGIETYEAVGYYTAQMSYQTEEVVGNIPQYVIIAQYAPEGSGEAAGEEDETAEEPEITADEPTVPDVPEPDVNVNDMQVSEAQQFDAQTGNPLTDLFNNNVPRGSFRADGVWSVLSLLIVLVALLCSAVLILSMIVGRRKEIEKYAEVSGNRIRLSKLMQAVTVIAGVIAALIWYLLDDMSLKMVMLNKYTIIIFAVFAVQVLFFILSNAVRRGTGKREKDDIQTVG